MESDTPPHPEGPIARLSSSENEKHATVVSMHHEYDIQLIATLRNWKAQADEFEPSERVQLEIDAQQQLINELLNEKGITKHREHQELIWTYTQSNDEVYLKALARQLAVMPPSDIHSFLDYQFVKLLNNNTLKANFTIELNRFVAKYIGLFPSKKMSSRLLQIETWNSRKTTDEWSQIAAYYAASEDDSPTGSLDASLLKHRFNEKKFNSYLNQLTRVQKATNEQILPASEHDRLRQVFFQSKGIVPDKYSSKIQIGLDSDELSVYLRLMWRIFYAEREGMSKKLSWSRLCAFALALFDIEYASQTDSFARRGERLLQCYEDKRRDEKTEEVPANIERWLSWEEQHIKADKKADKAKTKQAAKS